MATVESDKSLEDILKEVRMWGGYTRLPPRLERNYPVIARQQTDDLHSMAARLAAIETMFANRSLGSIIDLGGNSGYFSLSLVDDGIALNATVYDAMDDALAAGRHMATLLGIDKDVHFIKQNIDLAFIENLPNVDAFLCLNFLHNAGLHFDVERVRQNGWGQYAERCLRALREKSRVAIVSVGLDQNQPVNWSEPVQSRPQCFKLIAGKAGWTVRYYANMRELERLGVDAANGRFRRTSRARDAVLKAIVRGANSGPALPIKEALKHVLRGIHLLPKLQNIIGTQKFYHLYILEI